MIKEVTSIEDANICDELLTKLILDERKYNEAISENTIIKDYFRKTLNDENSKVISRGEIIKLYIPYVQEELEKGSNVHMLASPLHSLLQGQTGSRKYKQLLSSANVKKDTLIQILNEILETMPQDILWN